MMQHRILRSLACLFLLLLAACAASSSPEATAGVEPTNPQPDKRAVTSSEYGLSLAYDPALAREAVIRSVEPVTLSPDIMFAEAHPAYLGVSFPGYALARAAQLPYPIREPQVMIFRTGDFAQYSSGSWNDFPSQQAALEDLLANGVSAERCAQPPDSSDSFLPYLPWTNAAQVFCAQLKELTFGSGKGIRYLTSYSQGIDPVLDPYVFYTFQGLTSDGQYYVSAVFPVDTGVFPEDLSQGFFPDPAEMRRTLANQISTLNDQSADAFQPSLDLLDEMLQSITLTES